VLHFVRAICASYSPASTVMWLPRFVLVLIGMLLSPAARAQLPPEQAHSYEVALADAMQAYQARDWAAACTRFEQALELYPNARALRGLGVAAFENEEYARAVRALESALVHPERPLSPDLRELTELLAREARNRLGTFRVELSPPEATLLVGDAAASFEGDGTLLLLPGQYLLRAQAHGHQSAAQKLEVRAGEQRTLSFVLVPLAPDSAPAVAQPTRVPTPEQTARAWLRPAPLRDLSREPLAPRRIGALTSSGVAVLGAASAVTLFQVGRSRIAAVAEHCSAMTEGCEVSDADRRLQDANLTRLIRGVNASLAVASAAAVAAVTLWVLELAKRPDARERRASSRSRIGMVAPRSATHR
jgi:hypothetical protein